MSNIDKQAQKELYAKVEQQAHSLRGSPREYQALTGLCPVNVIEMHAQKIQALLDELEAKDKSISFLKDQLAQLANFNPDWDKLEAATDSLREHMAELTAARKRIAELEAREVKLPERYEVDMCPTPSPDGEWYSREDILAALVSADVSYADGNGKGK
ncbi:ead/Ea22-like family protein [Enterobacter hormaechei]|nr:ead/Ea22-like family protein [Enterobacter hormaechei]HAV1672899.1 hypothetical protein [Enterobacter hormaechei subsp. xiangfangensis]HAV1895997.1 hypothetical protein [Enterobacter hormaechei subsp. xiangfangensis]HAV1948871.1 hypothetical protein [Enterobacter hormaechei subsp. xiangfangensis]HBN0070610.1 ead/Ea22-like family protein [Enterobacter hormaechei subsp. xiangfangensis]